MIELTFSLLKRAIKTILDFYTYYVNKNTDKPSSRDLAVILFYELSLDSLDDAYYIIEYLNNLGFLLYDNGYYKINLNML